jgi:osmotically-inducible protein OsmY
MLATGIGVGAGFAIARLVQPKPLPEVADEFTSSADQLATGAPAGTGLVDAIRAALDGDPRTGQLDDLTINVAEGTVFVRGTVPEDTDQDAIREVISHIPGVTDVDLQLGTAATKQ